MKVPRDCEIFFYTDKKSARKIDGIIEAFFYDSCQSKISPSLESVRGCFYESGQGFPFLQWEIFFSEKVSGIIVPFRSSRERDGVEFFL